MATVTLRPNESELDVHNVYTAWGFAGAASAHAALNDNSDASYAETTNLAGFNDTLGLHFGTTVLPALAQVRSVTPRIRGAARDVNPTTAVVRIFKSTDAASYLGFAFEQSLSLATTIATLTGASSSVEPQTGVRWSQSDIDLMSMQVFNEVIGSRLRLHEAYIDVVYNEAPVATVTAPAEAGSVTNDSTPAIAWTYTDPESDAQERVRVKVFSQAQYSAGGFDPEISTPTWDSGELFTSALSVDVGVILANGVYRAYVKVSDAGSSGRYSAWDNNTFTMNVVPPPVPALTATVDNTLKRVTLAVESTANLFANTNLTRLASNTAEWTPYSSNAEAAPTLTRSTELAAPESGGASGDVNRLRMSIAANTAMKGAYASVPVLTAGKTYTLRFRAFTSLGGTLNSYIGAGGNYDQVYAAVPGGTWVTLTHTFVATATGAGQVYIRTQVAGATDLYITRVDIHEGTRDTYVDPGPPAVEFFDFEYSDDAGVTWYAVRGGTRVTAAASAATVIDYESPPNTARRYRARAGKVVA